MKPWAALCIILTGCVTDEQAQNAAKEAYADCTMAAVRRLDDGKSDPASIAMGVAGACNGQYQALSYQMQQNMSTDIGQARVRDEMKSNELRLATAAVLTYRANRKNN